MEPPSSQLPNHHSQPPGVLRPKVGDMDLQPLLTDDPSESLWDFGDFLDFSLEDQFSLPPEPDNLPSISPQLEVPMETSTSDRIRKRDPRLTCSNFLAGIVPCACPEMDAKLEEEEGVRGKKRARTVRSTAGTARCQVPGCEADIRELKGYHRRHRVCLRCANATAVVLDGESKRYCQQCGKFHVLSDFDEGKRSCRRKLERHNNRRRRKPDGKVAVENESQPHMQQEDVNYDSETVKDSLCFTSQEEAHEEEALLETEDGRVTAICSAPASQNNHGDSGVSFFTPVETPVFGEKDNTKYSQSPSYCDNKSAYSSTCPTGRISFKLYDWNPAEFPRRLRHQIFQWLSSMPVELEGYIRPGCTILTVFIAMPKFMWVKLLEDPVTYLHDFIVSPGRILSGRGTMLIYLNNMVFRFIQGGSSLMRVNGEVGAPRLHYVHPTCFEAGKPMEFVACGSNLRQPKFRFLISFSGKYMACDCCDTSPEHEGDATHNVDHQLYKIYIPHTEPDLFGPAFVEVENQSGLSNFIPILIGDKEICSEMRTIQERLDASLFSEAIGPSCEEIFTLRRETCSELITDVSWLLKKHASGNLQQIMNASQIQRITCLLKFLISNESTVILDKVLENLNTVMEHMDLNSAVHGSVDDDMRLFQKYLDYARDVLHLNLQRTRDSALHLENSDPEWGPISQSCSSNKMVSFVTATRPDMEAMKNGNFGGVASSSCDRSETTPLLNKEIIMNVAITRERPMKSCNREFSRVFTRSHPTLFVIAAVTICFGICAALFHPHGVGEFAVSIRRCLFGKF